MTDRNKALIVETLRYSLLFSSLSLLPDDCFLTQPILVLLFSEMAELMIWGDQHDQSFFDFFLEKNLLGYFLRIMGQSRDSVVHVQLLQTLSILLENLKSTSSLYYLLSNDRINAIISHPFDFSDEEVLAYYISFLKTLSLKLDSSTVQFFFNDGTQEFPLYTEAIKFFTNQESMVRVGVRTLTLAVFKVEEEGVRRFIVSGKAAPYFRNLAHFLESIGDTLRAFQLDPDALDTNRVAQHKFTDTVDEVTDMLYYLMDIYSLQQPQLNNALTQSLMDQWVGPSLMAQLNLMEKGDVRTALYLLGQLLYVVKDPALQDAVARGMLQDKNRDSLLQALQSSRPMPALFALYCMVRAPNGPLILQQAGLLPCRVQRQANLLAKVLGESASEPSVEPSSVASEEGTPIDGDTLLRPLLTGLLNAAQHPVLVLQMQCLLLRSLNIAIILHSPSHEHYAICAQGLHDAYCASLASVSPSDVQAFEAHVATYRQLVWTKLAQQPRTLLGLDLDVQDVAAPVHRMLALRELYWTLMGVKDEALPLRPSCVPLVQPGAPLCVTVGEEQTYVALALAGESGHVLVYPGHVVVMGEAQEAPLVDGHAQEGVMTGVATLRGVVLYCVPLQCVMLKKDEGDPLSCELHWEGQQNPPCVLRFGTAEERVKCETILIEGRGRVWQSKQEQLKSLLTPPAMLLLAAPKDDGENLQ